MRTGDLPGWVCAPSCLCSTPMFIMRSACLGPAAQKWKIFSLQNKAAVKGMWREVNSDFRLTWRPLFREGGGAQFWCEHSRFILMETSSTRPYIFLSRGNLSAGSWARLSPLTLEAEGDAVAAASHRKTDTFQSLCQADGPHSTNQQSWLVIPSAVMH